MQDYRVCGIHSVQEYRLCRNTECSRIQGARCHKDRSVHAAQQVNIKAASFQHPIPEESVEIVIAAM